MEKRLNIKQFVISVLSFTAKNWILLSFFCVLLFCASFLSFKYAFKHQLSMLSCYGCFCYLFYYVFVNLYYNQKPIFSSEKIVNSVIKMVVVFSLSLMMIFVCHAGLKLLRYMTQWFIGFEDFYEAIKSVYQFLRASLIGQFLIYIPLIFFLSFTFFIPGFAWISTLNGKDDSIWSTYEKVHGNYLKIWVLLFVLFVVFPFVINFLVPPKPFHMGMSHAIISMIQLVFYVKLYDFFYDEE